jgi:TonB-linked SusC/RagA family outer membrane protein
MSVLLAAQENRYTATVLDNEQVPVAGATVLELGTQNYVLTDDDGQFAIATAGPDFELQISFVGFEPIRLQVTDGNMPAVVSFTQLSAALQEVVVTALGIERQTRSITSSVEKVGARQLTDVPLTNVTNSLAGQVAGVQITNGSSGVGSSSRIIIRGENSLNGSNQPLFVVDGVPINNEMVSSDLFNNGPGIQEVDYGNGISEINPDDIESMTVLKGPGSAALYGSRAANGVVVITTKRGQQKPGLGVTTSSTLTFEGLLTSPDYQNVYGGGSNGEYAFVNGVGGGINDGGISSYGPRMEGQLLPQFDSPSVGVDGNAVRAGDVLARTRPDGTLADVTPTPWLARPDNIRDFFETGVTTQNNVAIASASEAGRMRLSYSNLRNKGILPNTGLERDGVAFSFDRALGSRLKVGAFANFINSRSDNRPNLGYGFENVMYGFNWTGRQVDLNSLKDYWQAGQEGIQQFNYNYLWITNPYLTLNENTNSFNKNRLYGNAFADYSFSEKLSLRLRTGVDYFSDLRKFKRAFSTISKPFGSYREDNIGFLEINKDFLLTYDDQFNRDWAYTVSAGGNRMDQSLDYGFTEATQLAVPGVYSLANARAPLMSRTEQFEKRINSLYGLANFSYQSKLFLNFNLRNDWSSTLPAGNNSFAYYAAGASYVLSNDLRLPRAIDYLKVRFNASRVGGDTDPYQLANTFQFNQNYGSSIRFTNEQELKNANLKPERLDALEAGVEIWLLNDRLQLDIAAYENTSVNQIIGRPISQASGFSNAIENGGEVRTRGLEARLSAKIIDKGPFKWASAVNFSTFESKVTRLPIGIDQFVSGIASVFRGSGGSNAVFYIAKEGGEVGDMYGTGFVEIDGQILYDANGLPVQDDNLRLLGNYNPDFSLGFSNQLTYHNFSLMMLWDWRHGGTIVSRTKALGSTSGVLKETLEGRADGVVGEGVMNVGSTENPQYVPNTTAVAAGTFYNNFFDRGNEASALYDASYLKLRQLSLYYTLPQAFSSKLGFQNLQLGVVGSNLLLFTENPHFDPELNAMQGRNQTFGVEDMSMPSARSYGVSIKTAF